MRIKPLIFDRVTLMTPQLIGERTLHSNDGRQIVVRLWSPEYTAASNDYECAFEITGANGRVERHAAGLDSFQALQLVLAMIGVEVSHIESALNVRFRFADSEDSGLPVPTTLS